jgi:serine protease Do
VSSQDVTPDSQQLLGLPSASGALIGGVMSNGPAAKNLQPGDVLVALSGVAITDTRALMIRTAEIPSGQAAQVQFWRDGNLQTASFKIAVPPPDDAPQTVPPPATGNIMLSSIGMAVAGAPPAKVLSVTQGGPAAKAGLVVNNVIEAVGGQTVTGPDDLQVALKQLSGGKQPVALLLVSGDNASGDDPGPRWVAVGIK